MVGDTAEDIGEPGLRIDAVEFSCFNQCVSNGGGFASLIRAHEQIILSPEGYAPHATLSGIIVDAQTAIFQIGPKPLEAGQAISDRTSQSRFPRDLCELGMKPDFQIVDEWCGMFLSDGFAPVRWITTNVGLNLIKLRNAFQGLFGNARPLGNMDIKELRLMCARQATSVILPPR